MSSMTTAKARQDFSKMVKRAATKKERIVLTQDGEELAALVPMEDLKALQEMEDRQDIEDARKALSDPKRIPYTQVRKELGLK